ncbi:MAG TPA: diaminopimelate epimerase [Gemmatimonadaceae bacterium]|nr:diaminopimelate epimerase [Gemmatimonadaceae bacterium]
MSSYTGREFVKMSGSGNDFVMVDARAKARGELGDPKVITRICAHGTGIGADGVVLLERSDRADVKLTYFNSDGSLADLCGNATLCTTRLAVRLGAAKPDGLTIETGAGIIAARVLESGDPEIDLAEVQEVRPEAAGIPIEGTEVRMGFVRPGIPHLVIEVPDLSQVDVTGRGRPLRFHPSLRDGANVNFIARDGAGWAIRTYERGVEGETLACGTGAVGSAIMVATWTGSTDPVSLRTRSGRTLRVRLRKTETGWLPSLSGEARFVFDGRFGEV